jgi:hypothetical protein
LPDYPGALAAGAHAGPIWSCLMREPFPWSGLVDCQRYQDDHSAAANVKTKAASETVHQGVYP